MGNAHATLTQAGLNIFSIELNVTVVLDPNLQQNYETYEHYGPRFQDSMSFNMYTSGSEINLANVEYILDEVQETCWNIENNKEFMLTAEDMYVYVKRGDIYSNIETIDILNDNEKIFVMEYPHKDDLRASPKPTLKTMKIDLGIIEVEKTESNPIAEKGVEEC